MPVKEIIKNRDKQSERWRTIKQVVKRLTLSFKEIIKNKNKNEKTTYKNNQTKHQQMLLEQRNHSSTAKKIINWVKLHDTI